MTKVLPGAVLTQHTNSVNLWDTRVLENAGTITLATADRGVSRSGTPAIRNLAGATIRKTGGGTSVVDPPVENDGAIVNADQWVRAFFISNKLTKRREACIDLMKVLVGRRSKRGSLTSRIVIP